MNSSRFGLGLTQLASPLRLAGVRRFLGRVVFAWLVVSGTASANTTLLYQSPVTYTWYSSYVDTDGAPSTEAADDFTAEAIVDRVTFYGRKSATSPILGVYVRFYDASATGGPGTLLKEYQLSAGDTGLTLGVNSIDVVLPTTFSATGHHFVSVQVISTSSWETGASDTMKHNGESTYVRSDNGAWGLPLSQGDSSMIVYGTVTGAPIASTVSPSSTTRSGYFEISGGQFAETGQVTVGGVVAHTPFWTNGLIKGYVAESTALGDQPVVVQTANGSSTALNLQVTDRVASDRLKWQFRLLGIYSMERPSIGADGTIYTVDVSGYLYALSPTGALKWVRIGGNAGVDIGSDGTIYSGGGNSVYAYDPDGTLKWRYSFTNPYGFFDVAVGPDGNIYVGTSGTDAPGTFSLTPTGQLRWNYPIASAKGVVTDRVEIAFGYNGSQLQAYIHTQAFTSDGKYLFLIPGYQAMVSSTQMIHTNYGVYRPDGTSVCSIPSSEAGSGYGLGANNTHWGYGWYLISYDESCREGSRFTYSGYVNEIPVTDSNNTFLLMGTTASDPATGIVRQATYTLDRRNGVELWRQTYPDVEGQTQTVSSDVRMTADNSVAYYHTLITGALYRGFLTALDLTGTGSGGGGGSTPPPPTSNNAPIANNDSATTFQKTAVKVKVLANDFDPDGDTIKVNSVAPDKNVTAQINSDGSLTIKPKSTFLGTATVTYDIVDSKGTISNRATVTVSVVKK